MLKFEKQAVSLLVTEQSIFKTKIQCNSLQIGELCFQLKRKNPKIFIPFDALPALR